MATQLQSFELIGVRPLSPALGAQESREILDRICDIVEAPENMYEHVWRVGDLVVWDNLSSLHARTGWPAGEPRTLRRVTIKGDTLF